MALYMKKCVTLHHVNTLTTQTMRKTLTLAALAILTLGSCSTQGNMNEANASLIGKWMITKAMGTGVENAETKPYIEFAKDGRFNGNASVNSFFGDYTVKGKSLKMDHVGMTRMMGANMDVENAVSKALNSTYSIEVKKNEANVKDKDGKIVMKLERK